MILRLLCGTLFGLNLPEHFSALCLCVRDPGYAGNGSPPPHPKQSGAFLSVINPPEGETDKREKKEREKWRLY